MIIFLGDSITEWGNWETLLPEFDIANYGVAGNKTYQILDRADDLFDKKADQLFLLVGINDLGENRVISDIITDYSNLVKLILDNNVASEINLVSILPIVESSWGKSGLTTSNISILNNLIKKLSKDKCLNFIDINSSFTNENNELMSELTTDGLHLSETGYEKYSNIISKRLKAS